jgi:hypothetical protein
MAEQDLPGIEGGRRERWARGTRGKSSPNNVCTCEKMNNF